MQQSRFVFVDLDGLSSSVRAHIRRQPAVFGGPYPDDSCPFDAHKLLLLLSGQDTAVSSCRVIYHRLNKTDKRVFMAAGWELNNKSAPEHRVLESLLKHNLKDGGDCQGKQTKSLVLASSDLKNPALLKCLDAYFAANWRIQLFCLRRCGMKLADQLRVAHPSNFQCVYLDRLMKKIVVSADRSNQDDMAMTSSAQEDESQRQGSFDRSEASSYCETEDSELSCSSIEKVDTQVNPQVLLLQQQVRDLSQRLSELRATAKQDLNQLAVDLVLRMNRQQEDFARQMTKLQDKYSLETQQLEQRATDVQYYHRSSLQEREEMLTCPITRCLFEAPVIATCCGKTFSKVAIERVQNSKQVCPWCRRTRGFMTRRNRDVANLVEQYKAERDNLV